MQESLARKTKELQWLKAAVESAKETILSQNQHITDQGSSLRQLKHKCQTLEEECACQAETLLRQDDDAKGHKEM